MRLRAPKSLEVGGLGVLALGNGTVVGVVERRERAVPPAGTGTTPIHRPRGGEWPFGLLVIGKDLPRGERLDCLMVR